MHLEFLPLVAGAIVGIMGVGLILDAWTPDYLLVRGERRRKPRLERDRTGEAAVGFGCLGLAMAFFGRDAWAYTVLAAGIGAFLLLFGTVRNRSYLAAVISHRGKLRRREQGLPVRPGE